MHCSPQSKIAPRSLFNKLPRRFGKFEAEEMLEFMDNPETNSFKMAKVLQVRDHILTIKE